MVYNSSISDMGFVAASTSQPLQRLSLSPIEVRRYQADLLTAIQIFVGSSRQAILPEALKT